VVVATKTQQRGVPIGIGVPCTGQSAAPPTPSS
jgi:hypothetical protein